MTGRDAKSPDTVLGERTLKKFAGLPFLLKILSAESALSLQVHPDKRQAVEGYAR
ncbi:type I phosphomannose isomerase catalytic subunit [Escherichia coli]|uniref:type I phosphomannose isomerase catalytic subunit n=1 Tax=Escherichia coli TaxID=562 RepID=UPI00278BCF10|nr:type I phosphomannose isomerase catalytic subunit [Escherichia coli]MDT0830806.1 type I phosphomannose isomerase catalytic subunit [Escherichia coli]